MFTYIGKTQGILDINRRIIFDQGPRGWPRGWGILNLESTSLLRCMSECVCACVCVRICMRVHACAPERCT